MFLVNCIEMVKNNIIVCKDNFKNLMDKYNVDKINDDEIMEIFKNSKEYMQMDDYVVDMHTSIGRKMGKNRKDFALEGSLVIGEYDAFLRKEWREYYIKEKLDNPVRNKKKKKKSRKKVKKRRKKEKIVIKVSSNKLKQMKLNFKKKK